MTRKSEPSSTDTPGEISGLPHSLPKGTLATLAEAGAVIALANHDSLSIYRITPHEEKASARAVSRHPLPGHPNAIADSGFGIVVAVMEECQRSALWIARGDHLNAVCELPGAATALVAGGSQVSSGA